jgi:acyl-CoA synthetase (AMP-forming)/AMP-acid ligase II
MIEFIGNIEPGISHGIMMEIEKFDDFTIVNILEAYAISRSNHVAFTFIEERGETFSISFSELHQAALSISQYLQDNVSCGENVLLLLPPGLDYVKAFFGCLYAGVVAVPLYPPSNKKQISRILAVIQDACSRAALITRKIQLEFENEFPSIQMIPVEGINVSSSYSKVRSFPADQLAFLQYTSGSTGDPNRNTKPPTL